MLQGTFIISITKLLLLYLLLTNIIQVIQQARMRWARHVARVGREEVLTGFWWGILSERNHFKYLRVDGKIILKWIFNGLDLSGSG